MKQEKIISLVSTWQLIRVPAQESPMVYLGELSNPDYSYCNSKIDKFKRFHKFNYGKKSIKIKYPSIYDDKKTEWEMMQELGFDRIWDCGKFCYELNFKK